MKVDPHADWAEIFNAARRMHDSPSKPLEGTIRVLAAVVRRDDRYLICQRPAQKRHGGLWEFPGGKLEEDETLLAAARRELFEELNVIVTGVERSLFSVADPGSDFVIEFVPTTIEGEPTCLEHMALRWLLLDDLFDFPLAPSDQRFAEFLRATGPRGRGGSDAG